MEEPGSDIVEHRRLAAEVRKSISLIEFELVRLREIQMSLDRMPGWDPTHLFSPDIRTQSSRIDTMAHQASDFDPPEGSADSEASPSAPALPGLRHVRDIGAGGLSRVFLYEQVGLGHRVVAVKVLKESLKGSPEANFFQNEVRILARLEHPNIVHILDSGVTSDGCPYIVMPYYPNSNLLELLEKRSLSVAEVLSLGIGVAGALETAHRAGVIHGDVKPANILVDESRDYVLADFGSARLLGEDPLEIRGVSLPWAAPETLTDQAFPGPASDTYGLAATMWHLLAGRPPFPIVGTSPISAADLAVQVRDSPAQSVGVNIPESLDRLLQVALSKRPTQRPAALEFARGLQEIERELRLPASSIVVDSAIPAAAGPERSRESSARTPVVLRRSSTAEPLGANGAPESLDHLFHTANHARLPTASRKEVPNPRARKASPDSRRARLPYLTSALILLALGAATALVVKVAAGSLDPWVFSSGVVTAVIGAATSVLISRSRSRDYAQIDAAIEQERLNVAILRAQLRLEDLGSQ